MKPTAVLDALGELVFILDREQRVTGAYGTGFETGRYKASQFIGKTIAEEWPADVAALVSRDDVDVPSRVEVGAVLEVSLARAADAHGGAHTNKPSSAPANPSTPLATVLTAELARRAAALRYDQLPMDIRQWARHCVLDWLGVTLAGAGEELSRVLVAEAAEQGGTPMARLIGHAAIVPTQQAALVNGAASHALDYDDVVIHVFFEPAREFYRLDRNWSDAQEVQLPEPFRTQARDLTLHALG